MSPFKIVYDHDPPTIKDFVTHSISIEATETTLIERQRILDHLHDNLAKVLYEEGS